MVVERKTQTLESLLDAALEQPPAARAAWLEAQPDSPLKPYVRELLNRAERLSVERFRDSLPSVDADSPVPAAAERAARYPEPGAVGATPTYELLARRRRTIAAAALVALALVSTTGAALWQVHLARDEARRAREVNELLVRLLRDADPQGSPRTVEELVRRARQRVDAPTADASESPAP